MLSFYSSQSKERISKTPFVLDTALPHYHCNVRKQSLLIIKGFARTHSEGLIENMPIYQPHTHRYEGGI